MDRLYDVVTFDCYGTLIDWNAGLAAALSRLAEQAGVSTDRTRLLAAYHKLEPVVESEGPRSYREVLSETARRVFQQLEATISAEQAAALPECLPAWSPFPDTNPALERLHRAGYRLGILSNIDDDLLAATRRHFTFHFDVIVTAQQAGSYKPDAGHFERARTLIGSGRWLHAAQSYFHDIVPAATLGVPSAWINRLDERPTGDARPDREFPMLTGLADWLAG